MSAGHQVRHYLDRGVTVPASQAGAPIASFAVNDEMRLNLVVDIVLGQVAGTPSLELQDSTGLGFWNNLKSAALSASMDQTVTSVAPTTGTLTIASHGYTSGQLVAVNSSGLVPGGLLPGTRYYVANPTTNTFQLGANPGNVQPISSFADAGTGTITVTAATEATIRMNVNVSGDQASMPLRPLGRITATTTGGQTVQVLDVRVGYTY